MNRYDELTHYGVLGMKWGVRKDKRSALQERRKKKIERYSKGVDKDIASFKPYTKTGIKSKSGKVALTAKDVQELKKALETGKKARLDKINKKYDAKESKIKDRVESKKTFKAKENVVEKARNNALKNNYEGKKNVDHIIKGAAGVAVTKIAGGVLFNAGLSTAGAIIGTYGPLISVGMMAGDMVNQAEYNRKYNK